MLAEAILYFEHITTIESNFERNAEILRRTLIEQKKSCEKSLRTKIK